MKRILAAILAVLYLSTSLGASVHLHYCMGRLISWDIKQTDSRQCDRCGMMKSLPDAKGFRPMGHCCSDEHKVIRSAGDPTALTEGFIAYHGSVDEAVAVTTAPFLFPGLATDQVAYATANGPPPPLTGPAIFLRNRNIRI